VKINVSLWPSGDVCVSVIRARVTSLISCVSQAGVLTEYSMLPCGLVVTCECL